MESSSGASSSGRRSPAVVSSSNSSSSESSASERSDNDLTSQSGRHSVRRSSSTPSLSRSSSKDSYTTGRSTPLSERGVSVQVGELPSLCSSESDPELVFDPSCVISTEKDDDMIVVDNEQVSVKSERERLMAARDQLLKDQRTLMAKEYMKEQGVVLLKALADPEFALRNDIHIILEIGGQEIQLAPPLDDPGHEQQTADYKGYVFTSVSNMLKDLPSLKSLRDEMAENDKIFKSSRKKFKKVGVDINLKLQRQMLQDTSIVLELGGLSGTIRGVPQSEIFLPDEALAQKPKSRIQPESFHVRVNEDELEDTDELDLNHEIDSMELERELRELASSGHKDDDELSLPNEANLSRRSSQSELADDEDSEFSAYSSSKFSVFSSSPAAPLSETRETPEENNEERNNEEPSRPIPVPRSRPSSAPPSSNHD